MAEVPSVDGYSDLIQVAKGGFGTVYRARQDRLGRVVALKVLHAVDLDERGRQRFERECVAMGSLSWHPSVVALHDSGLTTEGHPFLVMEFLDAGSLADRLRNGPLPWPEAVVVGVQVAGALDVAHEAGILHRDLKPENILIGPYGEAKLGDFGIAGVEDGARTTTGHASFTVAHVAPEVIRGQRPDERSDLYGLASTLHLLISGAAPFATDAGSPISTQMMRVLEAPPPRLAGGPDDLADVLVRTLAKEPADRPVSAAAFGRDLQRVQTRNGQPVTGLRLAPTPGADGSVIEGPPNVAPVPAPVAGDPFPTFDHRAPDVARGDPHPTIVRTQSDAGPLVPFAASDGRADTSQRLIEVNGQDAADRFWRRAKRAEWVGVAGVVVPVLLPAVFALTASFRLRRMLSRSGVRRSPTPVRVAAVTGTLGTVLSLALVALLLAPGRGTYGAQGELIATVVTGTLLAMPLAFFVGWRLVSTTDGARRSGDLNALTQSGPQTNPRAAAAAIGTVAGIGVVAVLLGAVLYEGSAPFDGFLQFALLVGLLCGLAVGLGYNRRANRRRQPF